MKKKYTLKKVLICSGYLLIGIFLIFSIFFLIQKTSSKENGNIVQAMDNNSYFRNVNPKFNVDFVNGEYVRFESVKSYKNPFEETKESIWEKIKYYLGLERKKMGLELRLESISYDETISRIAGREFEDLELRKNIELIQSGRNIYGEESKTVSKDTIVSRGIHKGIDIEYQIVEGKGLKEEIILQELPEYKSDCDETQCILPANKYTFRITLDEGLELHRSITSLPGYPSGTQYLTDGKGNYFAHFLPEFAVDALGNKTSKVFVDVRTTEKKNEYIYELILDANWLLSEERVFPIRIDPSIVHDSSLSFDMGEYDRTVQDQTSSIRLNNYLSGEYVSGALPLGGSAILENIYWNTFGSASGDKYIPFSKLGILVEENLESLAVGVDTQSRTYTVNSATSSYFTIELWKYQRYRSENIQEYIFRSNLGNLITNNGKYSYQNANGEVFESNFYVEYNKWNHVVVVLDLNNNQIHLYIDGKEEKVPVVYGTQNTLGSIIIGGNSSIFGYIDVLRAYNRLLTSYEVISNSQYAQLFLTYRSSNNGRQWGEWIYNSKISPLAEDRYEGKYITTDSGNLGSYDLLAFLYRGDSDSEIYINKNPIEAGIESEKTYILESLQGQYSVEKINYLDFWFKPKANTNSCMLNVGNLSIYTNQDGKVAVRDQNREILSDDSYILNTDNHVALKVEGSNIQLYLNGNKSSSEISNMLSNSGEYSIGGGCSDDQVVNNSSVVNVRISEEENIDIYSVYSKKDRVYTFKPSFNATLENPSGFSSTDIKNIYIREKGSTSSNYVQNLSVGETIVLDEEIGGQKFILEGEVLTINKVTGLIAIKEWIGNFPQEGFSEKVKVYKWQREYIPLKSYLGTQQEFTSIFIYGQNLGEIKDIELITPIKESEYSAFSGSVENQFLQYKFIFTTKYSYLTPYLSSVNINYVSGGPSMDQIMRHGKWFNDGEKQPFWWAK